MTGCSKFKISLMKSIFIICGMCFFLLPTAFSQNTLKIEGTVRAGAKIDKVYLNYVKDDEPVKDSAAVVNNRFTLSANVSEPTFAMLRVWYVSLSGKGRKYEARQIFLEPGVDNRVDIKDSLQDAKITGGKALNDFFELQKLQKPFDEKRIALNDTYRKYWQEKDTSGMQATSALINTLDSTMNENVYHIFFDKKPTSPIGLFVLQKYIGYAIDPVIAQQLFNKMSVANQQSPSGISFQKQIDLARKTAVGTQALNFTQDDTLGKPVSFSDFRGKYVLLDFWASWCGPCRAENPNVVKAFNEYKDKNFTVLSVSLDQPGRKQAWLDAIHKDGLSWNHVSDLKGWDNEVANQYGIRAIPQNLLIDPTGKIIAKNINGKALDNKLSEIFNK